MKGENHSCWYQNSVIIHILLPYHDLIFAPTANFRPYLPYYDSCPVIDQSQIHAGIFVPATEVLLDPSHI